MSNLKNVSNVKSSNDSILKVLLKDAGYKDVINKLEELQDIDYPVGVLKLTALSYYVINWNEKAVESFLKATANPFKQGIDGSTPFSFCLAIGNMDVAVKFSEKSLKSIFEIWPPKEKEFLEYFGQNICLNSSEIREVLGINHESAKEIFPFIQNLYDLLGEDGDIFYNFYDI